jgi:hypothetical protein
MRYEKIEWESEIIEVELTFTSIQRRDEMKVKSQKWYFYEPRIVQHLMFLRQQVNDQQSTSISDDSKYKNTGNLCSNSLSPRRKTRSVSSLVHNLMSTRRLSIIQIE